MAILASSPGPKKGPGDEASGYLYFTILNDGDGGWLASQDGPLPIVYCTNKQVKGGG